MPFVVRQALASRLLAMPELNRFLADISLVAGVPVRFWPASEARAGDGAEVVHEPQAFCARVRSEEAGCRMCVSFRQKLREQAAQAPAMGSCDAGLWEVLVPVPVGGQTAGHFVVSGVLDAPGTTPAHNRVRHLLARRGLSLTSEEVVRLRVSGPVLDAAKREALAHVLQAGAERIARAITEHLANAPESVPPLVEQAFQIVHAEFARPLRVPVLAERMGVSAAHLSRTFHHVTGLRLVDYVARYRAERARARLVERGEPVAEVARACGFASISQFNRVFRATFGTSPRKLRS
jgi:AraC-like DNA-binding protein/ligand-binding sensor protein